MTRVHPKTVTDHSKKGAKVATKKKRRPITPKSSKVQSMTVYPPVWKKAMQLAKNDRSRIEVISETDVIVHN